jgi:hypothetical protein
MLWQRLQSFSQLVVVDFLIGGILVKWMIAGREQTDSSRALGTDLFQEGKVIPLAHAKCARNDAPNLFLR